jgi:tRNA threonylcarbamoyladenosine biosynthesis protein TsaB
MMQLAIDSASDELGVALAEDGAVIAARIWETRRNHSVELLPAIQGLLDERDEGKDALRAVFVDIGPGGYAALRVGVSVAKGIAHGLGVPVVAVGRLLLDAEAVVSEADARRIVAVHRAGRGEVAWAAYCEVNSRLDEHSAPALIKAEALAAGLAADDALTGELDDALTAGAEAAGTTVLRPQQHRVYALARVGHQRLTAGAVDDPRAVVPVYLRAPAIGPQG